VFERMINSADGELHRHRARPERRGDGPAAGTSAGTRCRSAAVHTEAATGRLCRVVLQTKSGHGSSLPPGRQAGVTTPSPGPRPVTFRGAELRRLWDGPPSTQRGGAIGLSAGPLRAVVRFTGHRVRRPWYVAFTRLVLAGKTSI
jgi:hypothetical protein